MGSEMYFFLCLFLMHCTSQLKKQISWLSKEIKVAIKYWQEKIIKTNGGKVQKGKTASSLKFNQLRHSLSDNLPHATNMRKVRGFNLSGPGKRLWKYSTNGSIFFHNLFSCPFSPLHLPNESAACVHMPHCSACIWSVLLTRSAQLVTTASFPSLVVSVIFLAIFGYCDTQPSISPQQIPFPLLPRFWMLLAKKCQTKKHLPGLEGHFISTSTSQ